MDSISEAWWLNLDATLRPGGREPAPRQSTTSQVRTAHGAGQEELSSLVRPERVTAGRLSLDNPAIVLGMLVDGWHLSWKPNTVTESDGGVHTLESGYFLLWSARVGAGDWHTLTYNCMLQLLRYQALELDVSLSESWPPTYSVSAAGIWTEKRLRADRT